jgi:hypothetical protein
MTSATPWTAADNGLLRRHYASMRTADLAVLLARPVTHVYAQAYRLGLRKGAAFHASSKSGRILKGGKLSQATQFQPGHTSWNKGTHYCAGGRSAEHRFKPGNKPHTWRPVGSTRINADGMLDRKVSDTGYPPRDWVGVHRLVWAAAHGPVPAGHAVVFKPGRRTTVEAQITLDAIELVTRRELLARNSVHRHGPEVAQIAQLRGAIKRQIDQRANAKDSAQ